MVTSDAHNQGRECLVVLRSGDLVRVERQRFADDYTLAGSPNLRLPAVGPGGGVGGDNRHPADLSFIDDLPHRADVHHQHCSTIS